MTRRERVQAVEQAIRFRWANVQNERAANEGLALSQRRAVCDGLGAAAARYARAYALHRMGVHKTPPNAGKLRAGEVASVRALVERRLWDAGLIGTSRS